MGKAVSAAPVHVLGELFNVLTTKAGRSRAKAREAVLRWGDTFPLIETSSSVQLLAMDLVVDHHMGDLGRPRPVGRRGRQLPPAAVRGSPGRVHMERRHRLEPVLDEAAPAARRGDELGPRQRRTTQNSLNQQNGFSPRVLRFPR